MTRRGVQTIWTLAKTNAQRNDCHLMALPFTINGVDKQIHSLSGRVSIKFDWLSGR